VREFVSRYIVYIVVALINIVLFAKAFRLGARARKEFADDSLTPDWSSKRIRKWRRRIDGDWNGRAASVGMTSDQKGWRTFAARVEVPVAGSMRLSRREGGFLERPIVFGGPPVLTLTNPRDQDIFIAHADDASLVERILANLPARAALDGALRRPQDFLALKRGRLSLTIRRGDPPLGKSVRELLDGLGAARAALGA